MRAMPRVVADAVAFAAAVARGRGADRDDQAAVLLEADMVRS